MGGPSDNFEARAVLQTRTTYIYQMGKGTEINLFKSAAFVEEPIG